MLTAAARTRQLPPLADTRPAARAARDRRTWLAMAFGAVAPVLVVVLAVAAGHVTAPARHRAGQQHQVAAVLTAPDARIVAGRTLVGGTATVVASRRLHELVFTSAGLPVLASSKVYQLWLIGPSGATSAGLLPEASRGSTEPVLASGLAPGTWSASRSRPAGAPAADHQAHRADQGGILTR